MSVEEYLRTRVVELTVHSEDLAASADVDPPTFEDDTLQIAIDVLMGVARIRHGAPAIVRALARRERDTANVLRVL